MQVHGRAGGGPVIQDYDRRGQSPISSRVMDLPATIVEAATPPPRRRLRQALAILVFQTVAGAFFVIDAVADVELSPTALLSRLSWLESVVATALIAAIVLGARLTRQLFAEATERERVIAIARGALAEVIAARFAEWRLSSAETDVALFALKGCSIAEIAAMRGSAEGTVRSQLSQVYAKAGVSSQTMFVALFVEELLGIDQPAPCPRAM